MSQVRVVSAFWSASTGSYVTLERKLYSIQSWKEHYPKTLRVFYGYLQNCNFDF